MNKFDEFLDNHLNKYLYLRNEKKVQIQNLIPFNENTYKKFYSCIYSIRIHNEIKTTNINISLICEEKDAQFYHVTLDDNIKGKPKTLILKCGYQGKKYYQFFQNLNTFDYEDLVRIYEFLMKFEPGKIEVKEYSEK